MPILQYDSSFDGLLCTIAKAFNYSIDEITIQTESNSQLSLIDEVYFIATDSTISKKIYERIVKLWKVSTLENIYKAYLYPDTETLIYKYIYFLSNTSTSPLNLLSHVELTSLQKRINSVSREIHRYKGFIRFQELKTNYFYSSYEPQFDITNLIIPHFVNRFPNQNLIIHDESRNYAAMYNQKQVIYYPLEKFDIEYFLGNESDYTMMWKEYLNHLTIKERINKKRQMSLMPKKYWPFITEMK